MTQHDRRLGLVTSLLTIACMAATLMACSDGTRPIPPVECLATDVHLTIGGTRLILPFAALEDFAYRKMTFSFDHEGDQKRARDAADDLLERARDPKNPLVMQDLTVVVRTYGWNDSDMRQRRMCPLLTRQWAKSVCDNPWAAVQQALPQNRFKLIDVRRLSNKGKDRLLNCVEGSYPLPSTALKLGAVVLICQAHVFGDEEFSTAFMRLDENLAAVWTVWSDGPTGETAKQMAEREGKAISAFVRNAIGAQENFPALFTRCVTFAALGHWIAQKVLTAESCAPSRQPPLRSALIFATVFLIASMAS